MKDAVYKSRPVLVAVIRTTLEDVVVRLSVVCVGRNHTTYQNGNHSGVYEPILPNRLI